MLRQRVLTALLLLPLVVGVTLFGSTQLFALFMALVVALAGAEWSALAGRPETGRRTLYAAAMLVAVGGAGLGLRTPGAVEGLLLISVIWWLVVLGMLIGYRGGRGRFPLKGAAGFVTLLPMWVALILLHGTGGGVWVLFVIGITVCADTGAYFAGKRWGRAKLAPEISPGKTREGVVGGMVSVALYALALALTLEMGARDVLLFVLLCVVVGLFSVVGDLFESVLKREVGLKDSGRLLPGHGGILDRIDSLTAAAPLFLSGWIALGLGGG